MRPCLEFLMPNVKKEIFLVEAPYIVVMGNEIDGKLAGKVEANMADEINGKMANKNDEQIW